METVSLVLILLFAVVVSSAITRALPIAIPAPIAQIATGVIIGLFGAIRVTLDPELLFYLLLPPLLFLDGWRLPKDSLFRDSKLVLELALALVIFTVFGIGYLIHWMIPVMPLPVAFALGAVLSPTDPIAVSSITARSPIPPRMMRILERESLLNDASGLVCLRFAVATAMTGAFVLHEAALQFVWMGGAGLAIGILMTLITMRAKEWFTDQFGEESGPQIVVSLLIPFGAYILAEKVEASGIIAAVAAGLTMTFSQASRQSLPATRMRQNSVWDALQFVGHGIIFVLLGEQLPNIVANAERTVASAGHPGLWWLAIYVFAVTGALMILRFAWVWTSLKLTPLRGGIDDGVRSADLKLVAAFAVAGVRGAITLAGILTLPILLGDGTSFPARDLAIFIAAGVILLSLCIASVALPMLLRGLEIPGKPAEIIAEDRARIALATVALATINEIRDRYSMEERDHGERDRATGRIADIYREIIAARSHSGAAASEERSLEQVGREVRLAAVKAQRTELTRLMKSREISSDLMSKLLRELDLLELHYRA
ncbi:Na+/H+ antiporter [Stakelama sediminis]|uniref:Na+/H+ antiporter n=1 Tax=Stakelama sediminis TaxID=463200 RepID=UPI00161F5633|nr:Na+/H+ antiporter [Stakelama sediminis]